MNSKVSTRFLYTFTSLSEPFRKQSLARCANSNGGFGQSLRGLFAYANRQSTAFRPLFPSTLISRRIYLRLTCNKKKRRKMRTHLNTIIDENDSRYWTNSIACLLPSFCPTFAVYARYLSHDSSNELEKTHIPRVRFFFFRASLGSCRVRCARRPLTQTVVHFSRQSAFFIRTWLGA